VTPAVVVGGTLNSLGIVRSLASAGIPVYIACDTRFCPAGLSRQCTLLWVPDLEGQGLVDGLLSIAGRIGEKAVLILSSDVQVLAVSRARAALEAHYFLALPTETMVDVLMDKAKFQAYAEEIGLRVPRAVVLEEGHDEQALDVLSMPVVVKPADHELAPAERTTRADTVAEARAVARRMRFAASSVVVQEWIDGDDDDIYFALFVCDGQARIVALFTGRKMICNPPLVGSTALCVAAATEQHQTLAAQTQAFVTDSHYHGIGGLEFKRHRRTGQFVVVEPTVGRTDWQEEIATLCGVNIPAIAYRTVLGEHVESAGAIDPTIAWRASFRYRPRAGALPPGTRIVDGYFRRADPLPGVYSLYAYLRTSAPARIAGRFVKQWRSRPVTEPIPRDPNINFPVTQTSTIGG
jgi:predicted ATP-grasp superfamily ATP-dependent carboligase